MKSFTTHYKDLARLGLPIVIGQLGIIFVSFVDTFMVSRHGTNDLAAARSLVPCLPTMKVSTKDTKIMPNCPMTMGNPNRVSSL